MHQIGDPSTTVATCQSTSHGQTLFMPDAEQAGRLFDPHQQQDNVDGAEDSRIACLKSDTEKLSVMLDKVRAANKELKHIVDQHCSSPSQKRLMLSQLEQTHSISRRSACRLLGLARSTCWYKSESTKSLSIRKYLPRTPIQQSERVRLLRQIARDVKAGNHVTDDGTLSFIETSLKQLGLNRALSFTRTNLGLAMEIFEIYLLQYCG